MFTESNRTSFRAGLPKKITKIHLLIGMTNGTNFQGIVQHKRPNVIYAVRLIAINSYEDEVEEKDVFSQPCCS